MEYVWGDVSSLDPATSRELGHPLQGEQVAASQMARVRLDDCFEKGVIVERIFQASRSVQHSQMLLKQMLIDSDFTDCKLVCSDGELACHRIVLAKASPVWRAALTGNFRESHDARIVIQNVDLDVAGALLKYVYTGEVLSYQAMMLFPLAHQYELRGLIEQCVKDLYHSMNKENVVQIVSLLSTYIEHEKVAVMWPSILDKLCSDRESLDEAMRCVRPRMK